MEAFGQFSQQRFQTRDIRRHAVEVVTARRATSTWCKDDGNDTHSIQAPARLGERRCLPDQHLGPMLAGLTGGPLIGLAAGIIGGVHRFSLGGLTAVSCGLSTILSGLACGFIYLLRGGRLVGVFQGMLIAAIVELLHMGVILLICRPFSDAFAVVESVTLPMIAANSVGMFFSLRTIVYKFAPKANTE